MSDEPFDLLIQSERHTAPLLPQHKKEYKHIADLKWIFQLLPQTENFYKFVSAKHCVLSRNKWLKYCQGKIKRCSEPTIHTIVFVLHTEL